ncbi:MAG: O-antigen polymerase [Elusimicrobiota bacterium]
MNGLIITVLLLVSLTLFARIQQGNWLSPGVFFTLYWTVFVVISFIGAPDYYVGSKVILWIFVASFAVYVGSIIGLGRGLFKIDTHFTAINNNKLKLPGIKQIILISTILGLASVYILLQSKGYSFFSLFSFDAVKEMGRVFSIARYLEGYEPPFLSRILLTFVYLGTFLGGTLFAFSSSKACRLISLLPFLPAVISGVVQTTRASILIPGVLWVSSYLSSKILLDSGRTKLFNIKYFVAIFGIIIFIIVMFFALAFSRYGYWKTWERTLPEVWSHNRSWFFGEISAFSYWFEQNWIEKMEPTLGCFSFAGLYDLIGLTKRHIGIYISSVEVAPREFTNVYTIFRGLIEDFTLHGSLLILFIFGIIGGWSYRGVVQGKITHIQSLVFFYFITLWSPVVSLFNYNTILLSWLLFSMYLIAIKLKKREIYE